MHLFDWFVVAIYCVISLILGLALSKKASAGVDSYFAGNRNIAWWLAGSSMAATAFSSDTPLLVTGIVRSRGLWGNWEIWSLAISTMLAVFFFSKLWKRTGVLTEVEFVELRYSGKSAAVLRGAKALYWGLFYNAFIIGAWPITGLVKVMQETTGWSKPVSIFFCLGLATLYTSFSGYMGVVLTDLFQLSWALIGAFILAFFALKAVGGPSGLVEQLADTQKLSFIPPSDHFSWLAGLLLIQWWAWKNADGGGLAVQRMVSCKNEKEAMLSMLWFNIVHYALRSWPWIVTALASLILIPDASLQIGDAATGLIDHERAYPRLITTLLPIGLRGVLVASFFAAFMSTVDSQLNWGASYLVNDFYKRFVRKDAPEKHYILISKLATLLIASLAVIVAFSTQSIGQVFTLVLNLTAGIGPVLLLRWFWPRVNAASEIAALAASLPLLLLRPWIFSKLGIPADPMLKLFFMVAASALVWIPVTFLTPRVSKEKLEDFYKKISPLNHSPIFLWLIATVSLLATTIGPLQILLGKNFWGWGNCLAATFGWSWVVRKLRGGSKVVSSVDTREGNIAEL